MSSTLKKIALITTVNSIFLLTLGRPLMAAPTFPVELNCGQGHNCSQGEFCQEDVGLSYCVPCVDCSLFNRKAAAECARFKTNCGECLDDYHEIESQCSPEDNATKWSFENIVDKLPLQPDLPYSDAIGFVISAAVLLSGFVFAIFIMTRKLLSKATAEQLQLEILLSVARRRLEAARERVIAEGDDTIRPTVTEDEPLDYYTISTIQFDANDVELLAALDDEIRQEHQPRDIIVQNDEIWEGPDDFNETSALLEHTAEDHPSNEEPDQVVPQTENQIVSGSSRLQVETHGHEEFEGDIEEEFYNLRSQDQQQRLIE